DRDAVVAAIDQLAIELRALGPFDLVQAAVERDLIVAAVALALDIELEHGRQRIRHVGFADQIAAAELDAIDAEIGRHHVEPALAAEIRLETAGTPIGTDRRLVGDDQ